MTPEHLCVSIKAKCLLMNLYSLVVSGVSLSIERFVSFLARLRRRVFDGVRGEGGVSSVFLFVVLILEGFYVTCWLMRCGVAMGIGIGVSVFYSGGVLFYRFAFTRWCCSLEIRGFSFVCGGVVGRSCV